jgi:pilus assembly protein CpaE
MAEGENIRVVIVDDIAETRENIKKLLQFEPDVDVVGTARTGAEGIAVAKETKPDVILMDINMPDMDGITATEQIRKQLPATQIVILSVQSDSNYMRRAMLAGARDFLTKPPDVDELTAAIRRSGEMAQAERAKTVNLQAAQSAAMQSGAGATPGFFVRRNGKIIVVYGPKGGVGTTTIVSNLAIALHSDETPAVAVDGRLQFGDLSFFYNVQVRNSIVDMAGREIDPDVMSEVIIKHEKTGVDILAAPTRPEQAEAVTGADFANILAYLKTSYEYVVVDTSSMLNEVTLSAIDAATIILLLTTQDIPSIKNIRLFSEIAKALGIDEKRVFLIMNRFDKRRNLTPERVGEITKLELLQSFPLEERLVVPATDRGEPFIIDNASHSLSRQIIDLAKDVKKKIESMVEMEGEIG